MKIENEAIGSLEHAHALRNFNGFCVNGMDGNEDLVPRKQN